MGTGSKSFEVDVQILLTSELQTHVQVHVLVFVQNIVCVVLVVVKNLKLNIVSGIVPYTVTPYISLRLNRIFAVNLAKILSFGFS